MKVKCLGVKCLGAALRQTDRLTCFFSNTQPYGKTQQMPRAQSSAKKRKSTPLVKSPRSLKKAKHWSGTLEQHQLAALESLDVELADLFDIDEKPAPLWTAGEVQAWASNVAGESLRRIPTVAAGIDGPKLVAMGSAAAAADALFPAGVSKSVGKRVWSRLQMLRKAAPASLNALTVVANGKKAVVANGKKATPTPLQGADDPNSFEMVARREGCVVDYQDTRTWPNMGKCPWNEIGLQIRVRSVIRVSAEQGSVELVLDVFAHWRLESEEELDAALDEAREHCDSTIGTHGYEHFKHLDFEKVCSTFFFFSF